MPHYMERQCVLEIHPGTAPQELLHRDVGPSCLSGGRIFAGLGAFDELSRIFDAAFEKSPPMALQFAVGSFKALNCYVRLNLQTI